MTSDVARVIGANAKHLRLTAKVTLDQFSQAARFHGLPWSTGRVGSFESGHVPPNLEILYAVAATLGQVIGRPVSLAELLAGKGRVHLNDKLPVDVAELRAAVSGEPVKVKRSTVVTPKAGRLTLTGQTPDVLIEQFREADRLMCKSIGVTPEQGAAAMAQLWRRTLSDERDHRAEPGANVQRRGQISRQLKAELLSVIAGKATT